MTAISYRDFHLHLHSDGCGFAVTANIEKDQSVTEPLNVDLSRSWQLEDLERAGHDVVRQRGIELFDALIHNRVRNLYHHARGLSAGDGDGGLRIRLHLDPHDVHLRPLMRLPWELAFDREADGGHYPALDPRHPIVRTVDSIERLEQPQSGLLRRVLLAQASPRGFESLATERESAEVQDVLERVFVPPCVTRKTRRSTLIEAISDFEPQVVHFMGHGVLERATGEGKLILEDEAGLEDRLDAATFAMLFAGKRPPRLVVLSACLTATAGEGTDPFAAMAVALVAAGLPAVIAMQSEVLDRNAIRFSARLYRQLIKGRPIEAAVAEARKAVSASRLGKLDWAAPVLFVRGNATTEPRSRKRLPQQQAPMMIITGSVGTQNNIANYETQRDDE
jgi:hypothetical protein